MNKVFSLLFIFGIFFSFHLSAQKSANNIKKAEALYKKGKYKQDIKFLSNCIKAEVVNPEYFYLRAQCNMAIADRNAALDDATWAIKLAPDSVWYYNFRGTVYESMLKNSKAKKDYDDALSLCKNGKDSSTIMGNKGHVMEELGDTTGAINNFLLALKLDSNNTAVMCNLSMTLNDINRTAEAIALLEKILTIDSTFEGVYTNLGFCYSQLEKYDKAIECFNKSIAQHPAEPFGYNNRGYAKLKSGDLNGAMDDINTSLKIFPQNSYAYRNLGLVYLAKGDKEKACAAFDKAIAFGFTESYGPEVKDLQRKNCQ